MQFFNFDDLKKKFLPRRLYDTGLVVSTYLDVLENVFFIAENPSPSPIGEKNSKEKYIKILKCHLMYLIFVLSSNFFLCSCSKLTEFYEC
jgi:hypothetical protein